MALRKRGFTYCAFRDKESSQGTGTAVYCIEYEGRLFPFNHKRVPDPGICYTPVGGEPGLPRSKTKRLDRRISDTTHDLMLIDIVENGVRFLDEKYREFGDQSCVWSANLNYEAYVRNNRIETYYPTAYRMMKEKNSEFTYEQNRKYGKYIPRTQLGVIFPDLKTTRVADPEPIIDPSVLASVIDPSVYTDPLSSVVKSTAKVAQGEPNMNEENTLKALRDLKSSIDSLKRPTLLEEGLIQAVIEKTKDIATKELEIELQGKLDTFIASKYGALPKQLQVVINKDHTLTLTGLFHDKFNDILTMIANDIPVMVTGPAGSGKNFTLEQVSQALDIPFYYTGAITQEYKLTGFIDAGGHFHETEFYKAFKDGGLFMLDEVDASSPETLVILNGAIANRYFDFPTGRIKAHANFRIACAGNTFGTGADMIYVGRNVLDGATLDRFVVIKMGYDTEVEQKLCPNKELFQFILCLRNTVEKMKLRHIVGMRASINGYKSLEAGMSKAFIIESVILKGLSIDDITTIRKNLVGSMPSEWRTALDAYAQRLEGAR